MAKNWIAGAIKHPGALTRKAKRAGESPMAFAHSHAGASGTTGKQARLAITLSKFHKKSAHGSGPFNIKQVTAGYKVVSAPAYVSALTTAEHEGGAEQSVKGESLKRTPEARQVAGRV